METRLHSGMDTYSSPRWVCNFVSQMAVPTILRSLGATLALALIIGLNYRK
jgi:hypothetical protein